MAAPAPLFPQPTRATFMVSEPATWALAATGKVVANMPPPARAEVLQNSLRVNLEILFDFIFL
jgi:hypothetical protein